MPKKPKPERTNEEIRATVRDAIAPLGCVAEIWDYEKARKNSFQSVRTAGVSDLTVGTLQRLATSSACSERICWNDYWRRPWLTARLFRSLRSPSPWLRGR